MVFAKDGDRFIVHRKGVINMDTIVMDVPKERLRVGRIPRRITNEAKLGVLNLPKLELPVVEFPKQESRESSAKPKARTQVLVSQPTASTVRRPKRMWD